jgi:hypothetical protein
MTKKAEPYKFECPKCYAELKIPTSSHYKAIRLWNTRVLPRHLEYECLVYNAER